MYADDLVLVSASVTGLQKLVNLCMNELHNLDLKINASKSKCLRIGKHVKHPCSDIVINGNTIAWTNHFVYLGVTIKAGTKFRIDLKQARCKFYRSFNALYSKIHKANESVIVSLIKSFCVPTLLYSLEALVLNATLLNNIDEPMYNAIGKVFKTFDRRTIRWCMFYMNVLPLRYDYVCRRTKFLLKMQTTENNLLSCLFGYFGQAELLNIGKKFEIKEIDINNIKARSWKIFSDSLD